MRTATAYVHGYSATEARRLGDQADTLAELLHHDTGYPAGSRVLEVGCGVGAQTVHLVAGSPAAAITAVDVSAASLAAARDRVGDRVRWCRADLFALPFQDGEFEHLFVCFVLEHLPDPVAALHALRRVLRPGGTVTVIEGDHGSAFYHPASPHAQHTIDCLVRLQPGDALIGRRLHPLLTAAGFRDVAVTPRTVHADDAHPHLVAGFTHNTFVAMVEAVRDRALTAGLTTEARWREGIADLRRTGDPGGTFTYTFFKATGVG
ncbi:methyltransferase domain-containing protein [Actinophytocola xanthii]|uniref:SAM-dependent methyltransferase n=1 Tax=Actinophytocola xanthii TaxID=1912961 RepID=A0A1Q8CWQ5_9PSEU|nr:methyltransferase domain-containing protein [Actinophytocola xanthii]OLF18804.1 SAM-dependent methyltransferase [Actinophytocola xanthii]